MQLFVINDKFKKINIVIKRLYFLDNVMITLLPNDLVQPEESPPAIAPLIPRTRCNMEAVMHARRTLRSARQMVVNHGWATAVRAASDHLKKRLRRAPQAPDTVTWLSTAEHEFD